MKKNGRRMNRWVLVLLCICIPAIQAVGQASVLHESNGRIDTYGPLDWLFIENKGQMEDLNILYYTESATCNLLINRDGSIVYSGAQGLRNDKEAEAGGVARHIKETFVHDRKTSVHAEHPEITRISYCRGNNPRKWIKNIKTFKTLNFDDIYEGISLSLKARENSVEKIFYIRPNADAGKIKIALANINQMALTDTGELDIRSAAGKMIFSKPIAYQKVNDKVINVRIGYTVDKNVYGFKLGKYDKNRPLVIDPLVRSVFVGSPENKSHGRCMISDSQGNIYVAGNSKDDCFVVKFDKKLERPLGVIYFGGTALNYLSQMIEDIALGKDNAVYVTGSTKIKDFPVTENAFDTEFGGQSEGFVTKIDSDLSDILASTSIGFHYEHANALAIAPDGSVYIAGDTLNTYNYTPFPTTPGAYDTVPGEPLSTNGFVLQLDNRLENLISATLLGGDDADDVIRDMIIDPDGVLFVAGVTESGQFPVTTGSFDQVFEGRNEAFVAALDGNLKHLIASTYLGGVNEEQVNTLSFDQQGNIGVAGWTASSNFPVSENTFGAARSFQEDGFVTLLDRTLQHIVSSTIIGGDGFDEVNCLCFVDDSLVIGGRTASSDFPVTPNAPYQTYKGGSASGLFSDDTGDGFIAVSDRLLNNLNLSTYFGGTGLDYVNAIIKNGKDMYVAGDTESKDFPLMSSRVGYSDIYISRFNPDEQGPPPVLPKVPGNWRSDQYTENASRLFFDIDICSNGEFSGYLSNYNCVILDSQLGSVSCKWQENNSRTPISGTFNFEKLTGTITDGYCEKDVAIEIRVVSTEKMILRFNNCKAEHMFSTEIDYQGNAANCGASEDPEAVPAGVEDNGAGSSDGSGCFLSGLFHSF